ncbi:MAG: site-specific integrase, partial [Dehalococcoidia bacterium]|nr:site-specific integrase [Dehalococcoidia bacterium]
ALRTTTFRRYEEYVRLHVVPHIGRVRLSRLTPQHIQELYSRKLDEGLSPTTVHHLYAVLHRALHQALKLGLVARNVTEAVEPPRPVRSEHLALTPGQARELLAAARSDRLEGLYVLALTSGMRQGELLALRWPDVDLDGGKARVRSTLLRDGTLGEPKTSKGRRQITLLAVTIEALRRHRLRQYGDRLSVGPAWTDRDLVFTNAVGNFLDANNLRHRAFPALLKRAGVPRIRFHDLRHSTASLLMSIDVHPKVVQELLGHSQIAITMDTYSHLMPNLQREAMEGLDRLLAR